MQPTQLARGGRYGDRDRQKYEHQKQTGRKRDIRSQHYTAKNEDHKCRDAGFDFRFRFVKEFIGDNARRRHNGN